jgi:UDP-2-acetamido-3-amino-2,3-dideoxy-glucuronate N-acetyltransferase
MPISGDVKLGKGVVIHYPDLVNLYGCEVADETKIGPFVEIQKGAQIGRRCKISSHSFICEGVTIKDDVFVGHGVMFINDRYPRAAVSDWQLERTVVGDGASIGSGAAILCGITIGARAMIGAGAVVTHDVPEGATVAGVPARLMR